MNLSKLFETQKQLDQNIVEKHGLQGQNLLGEFKVIELTQGRFAIVDSADFEELSKHTWHYAGGYARRNKRLLNGKRKIVFMHRELMQTPEGVETDHINGNRLDNRCSNLRVVTKHENQRNAKPRSSSSKFKGVSYQKTRRHKTGYWVARIQVDGKVKRLGYFKCEIEAAEAYNEAAQKYFGKYAKLNQINHERQANGY